MPRLVDYTALGQRETGRSGRPVASLDLSGAQNAFAGIGNSISNVGDRVQALANQRESDDTRISTSTATANLLKRQNEFLDNVRNNPDDYPNWEKQYEQHIKTAQEESAGLIKDPRQRQLWQAQQLPQIEGWKSGIKKQAFDRQRDAFMAQTEKDISTLRDISLDPNTSEADKATNIRTAADMIEDSRRRGFITDQQAEEWGKKWQEGYALKRLEMMPAKERMTALAGVRHGTPQLAGAIKAAAKELGIDPVDLGTVISYETGGTLDPWQKGPITQWGQHRGLIQWGEPQQKKYGVYEGMPVEDQLKAVVAYMRDAGVKPGMGLMDVYSAVNAGSVGRYNASDAGNGGAPGTVADKVNNQMAGHRRKAAALLGGQSVDPVAERIPPDQRQRMYERAKAENERDQESEKITVGQLIRDDHQSLSATGAGVKGLTYDRIKDAISKDEADKWQIGRTIAKQTFDNTQGMDEMTDDQIRSHAEKFRPTEKDAGEGFGIKAKVYEAVQTKAQDLLSKRAEDPAASVDNSAPVRAARNALAGDNSLANREALISARLRQQQLLGVPAYNQSPITVEEAKSYAAKMRPLARGQADVADQDKVIQGIVNEIEQNYGSHAQEVLKRVLYQVTLKKDAAEVLATAIGRMQKTDAGPLVTTEENKKLEQGDQARSIAQMAGVNPFSSSARNPSPSDAPKEQPKQTYPAPSLKALQLLESDPQKYLPHYIQKYGPNSIPRNMRVGPDVSEMTQPKAKAKP